MTTMPALAFMMPSGDSLPERFAGTTLGDIGLLSEPDAGNYRDSAPGRPGMKRVRAQLTSSF
jgi:hypothetical protein